MKKRVTNAHYKNVILGSCHIGANMPAAFITADKIHAIIGVHMKNYSAAANNAFESCDEVS